METVKRYSVQIMDSLVVWITKSPKLIALILLSLVINGLLTMSGPVGFVINVATTTALIWIVTDKFNIGTINPHDKGDNPFKKQKDSKSKSSSNGDPHFEST